MLTLNKTALGGPTVALYSCFTAGDGVDEAALGRLVDFYLRKGVKSLYVCGSTGEGLLMSVEERKRTLEAVAEAAGGRMSLIVHVGANATRDAVALAAHSATVRGVAAVSAIPSVYYRYPERSIEAHWDAIMAASDLPFIIYNIPQLCGYDMTPGLFRRMLRREKVAGIKDSAVSVQQTRFFKSEGGPDFMVFNGPDEQYLAGRAMGADGGIGGTYGVMPELFLGLERLFVAGRIAEASELQQRINEIIEGLLAFPSLYGAAKAVMALRGVEIGGPRAPFEPVAAGDADKLRLLRDRIEAEVARYEAKAEGRA